MNSNGGTTWAPRAPLPSDGDGLCSAWPGYDPAEYTDRQGHVYGARTSGENGEIGGSCMPQNAIPSPLPSDSEENQGTWQPDAGGSPASPGRLGTTMPTFASCAGVVGTCFPNTSAYNQYPVTDETGSFLMNFWMQFGASNWCATQSSGCSGETFLIWTNGVAGCCPGPRFGVWTSDSLQSVCFGNQYGSVQNGDVECLSVPSTFDAWQMISLRYDGPSQTVSLYWNALQQGTALHFPASLWNQSAFANIGEDDTGAIDSHQLRIVSDGFWSYSEWVGSAADALVAPCGPGNSLCPSGSGSCNPTTNNACSYLGYLYNATGTGESPDTQQHALEGGPVTQAETAGPPNCSCSNPNLGQDTSGDPVNTSSGNFSETVTDLSIPGRGIPLAFTRSYNSSQAGVSGPLGYGWASNLFMSLSQPGGTGPVTIAQEGGAQIVFDPSGAGYAPAAPRDIDMLTHNGDGTWTFVRRAMDTFTFSSTGLLISEKDQNGYTTTFGYNGSNQLTTVTDPGQRSISLGWVGSDVSTITDSNVSPARQVTLQYNDGAGNLTDVTDVNGGRSHFVYDASHRLTNMYDPNCYAAGSSCNGGNGVVNGYNAAGQVGSQQDQLGRTTTFTYTGDPTSATGGTATITDPMSNVVVDTYQYGVLTSETKGYGTTSAATWSYTYDPTSAALASVTDPNGNTTRYFRDANGNQIGEIDPLGRYTSATYNGFNEPLTQTDALGVTTTSQYDASGNLTSVSTPLVGSGQTRTTTYTYGDSAHPGDVTAMQDPDTFSWSYTYDAYGDRTSVTDPLTDVSTTCYNADGWKLASYTPKAGTITCAVPPPSSAYETTYSYVQPNNQIDEFGDVHKVTDPLGHTTSSTYDADRNVVSSTDADGNLTRYMFDLANEQTDVVRADQSDLHTDYNLDGTVHDQKDGKGNAIQTYGYDPLDRVTSVSDAVTNTTSYTFDGAGNQLTQQDPGGNCSATPATGCTKMTYDAANELVGVTYSDGVTPNVNNLTYDADGQRTGMSDGTGSSTWVWDSLHRLTSFTDGHHDQVQYQYNLRGLITQITYPGSLPVTRGYDNAGRWNAVQDWLGNTTRFGYDANSNLATKTLPAGMGVVDTTGYNAADQNTSITDVKNSTTLFGATYGRDNLGQVASDSSLPAGVGADRYTSLNQLCYAGSSTSSACTTPPTGAQAYGFDAADNLTNANGTTQAFNAADELCWTVSGSSSNGCGSAPTGATTYGYDLRGNRTTVTPSSGSATHLGYDQANRLSSYGQGSTTTATYAYNGDGLRMSKTVSGVTSQFTWDVVSSPALLLSDGTTDYVYGPGNLVLEQITPQPAISLVGMAATSGKSTSLTLTLPAGVQTNDQVFVATTEPSTTTVSAPTGYTSVASVNSMGGSTPSTTVVYRHTVSNGDTSVTLTYSSRKTAQAAVLAVYRGIDPSTPIEVSQTGSASSGTTVTAPSATTAYGNERLAVVQGAAGSFSGKSWTAPSGTTEQVQSNATANASMGIADQSLGAAGATGTRVSTFGANANLTTVMLATPTPPAVLFAHADQLGSTRLLTDSAGVVRASLTYDPYGNVTASSGASSTPFGFAGQYKDAETGFYYLHARYYDPTTAQFLSRDPLVALTRSPYGYVAGNPLNGADPSGLLYTTTDNGAASASDLNPYQQVYATLSAVLLQEKALQNGHRLSASEQSNLVASIEGLMNQAYTEQTAINDRCSGEFSQLQASISAAATVEENLAWQEGQQNGAGIQPWASSDVQNSTRAGQLLGGAFGLAGGAGMMGAAAEIGTETAVAAAAGAVTFGIGAAGVVIGVWLITTAAGS